MNTNLENTSKSTNSYYENINKSSLKSLELLAKEGALIPPLKKLMGYYILENTAVLLAAERGVGKSWFGIQLCAAIASERKEFLGETIEMNGNTLFINFELDESVFMRRAHKLLASKSFNFDRFECKVYTTRKGIEEELEAIKNISKKLNPVLIVLDNFRVAFISSDTNSNRDIAKAMQKILELRDELQVAVLVVDHTRKHTKNLLTDSDLQAGSGVKSDLLDSDIFIRRSNQNKNLRILKRVKSRHSEEADGAKLIRLNPETLWFEFIEDNIDESDHIGIEVKVSRNTVEDDEKIEIKNLHQQGFSQRQIASKLKRSVSTVNRYLNEE